jgi:hypothetical protein
MCFAIFFFIYYALHFPFLSFYLSILYSFLILSSFLFYTSVSNLLQFFIYFSLPYIFFLLFLFFFHLPLTFSPTPLFPFNV